MSCAWTYCFWEIGFSAQKNQWKDSERQPEHNPPPLIWWVYLGVFLCISMFWLLKVTAFSHLIECYCLVGSYLSIEQMNLLLQRDFPPGDPRQEGGWVCILCESVTFCVIPGRHDWSAGVVKRCISLFTKLSWQLLGVSAIHGKLRVPQPPRADGYRGGTVYLTCFHQRHLLGSPRGALPAPSVTCSLGLGFYLLVTLASSSFGWYCCLRFSMKYKNTNWRLTHNLRNLYT